MRQKFSCSRLFRRKRESGINKTVAQPTIPFLPPEIHRVIALYIDRSDLPAYRLASKTLAAIGAEHIFQTVVFHLSSASITRVEEIKKIPRYRKAVRALVWDSNLWRIAGLEELREWKSYFFRKANYLMERGLEKNSLEVTDLNKLCHNWKEWEGYLEKVRDENAAIEQQKHCNVLQGFENLTKLYIMNGALVPSSRRGVQKIGNKPIYDDPPVLKRGEGQYDWNYQAELLRPGVIAARALQGAPELRITKLRIDALCFTALLDEGLRGEQLRNLTSLHLKITVKCEGFEQQDADGTREVRRSHPRHINNMLRNNHLGTFLAKLEKLESLRLDLGQHFKRHERFMAPASIENSFPPGYTWQKLRKLSLIHIDTTMRALRGLLDRHCQTLKDLRLCYVIIQRDTSRVPAWTAWPDVLQSVSETMHLERATVAGRLGIEEAVDEWQYSSWEPEYWDFDAQPELAAAVARYLVHGGQECPLNESNVYSGC